MVSKPRIFIVEDNVLQARKMQLWLRGAAYDVLDYATDCEMALKMARELKPDLALIDIGLPDGDGVEVARQLRDELGVKTVFVTNRNDPATIRRALDSLPVDFLTKPVTQADLCEAVEWALMDLPRLEEEIRNLIPDSEHWLTTPHEGLGGLTPKETMGTPNEVRLRQLLRAAIQGMLT